MVSKILGHPQRRGQEAMKDAAKGGDRLPERREQGRVPSQAKAKGASSARPTSPNSRGGGADHAMPEYAAKQWVDRSRHRINRTTAARGVSGKDPPLTPSTAIHSFYGGRCFLLTFTWSGIPLRISFPTDLVS